MKLKPLYKNRRVLASNRRLSCEFHKLIHKADDSAVNRETHCCLTVVSECSSFHWLYDSQIQAILYLRYIFHSFFLTVSSSSQMFFTVTIFSEQWIVEVMCREEGLKGRNADAYKQSKEQRVCLFVCFYPSNSYWEFLLQ